MFAGLGDGFSTTKAGVKGKDERVPDVMRSRYGLISYAHQKIPKPVA